MREVTSVAVVKSLRTARLGDRIAIMVEHGERVAMFQYARPPLLPRSHGRNQELRHLRVRLAGASAWLIASALVVSCIQDLDQAIT